VTKPKKSSAPKKIKAVRLPKKTWNQHPNTVEETLKALSVLQKWEEKTGEKAGYQNGVVVTVKFCVDLCERLKMLEKRCERLGALEKQGGKK